VELDPIRMCELLVGLPDVDVIGVDQPEPGELIVVISAREHRPECGRCRTWAWVKDRREVDLVDLPAFGQTVVLRVIRTRWLCPRFTCGVGSWTIEHDDIAPAGHRLTTRAARWVTTQVGRWGRTVNEVAQELGTDWHTVNTAVIAYGEALLTADVERIGVVHALSLDETLFVRRGRWRTQCWSTQIVDARTGALLDVVEGRDSTRPAQWLALRPQEWLARIQWAVMDLSGPYKAVFDTMLPDAEQVADPFHVIKHANSKLDECRRRVQNETLGHRGRKADPLYRCRRLLLAAEERLDYNGNTKLQGLLRAGDPRGDVAYAWHAKEAVRFLYDIPNPLLATKYLTALAADLQDNTFPIEVRSLGRTLTRWSTQISNWHRARASNGPIEAINNLIKRVKRVAFGFRTFRHYRIRSPLYAGRPDWTLLNTITPH
jgi:transposase